VNTTVAENFGGIIRFAWRLGADLSISHVNGTIFVSNEGLEDFDGQVVIVVGPHKWDSWYLQGLTEIASLSEGFVLLEMNLRIKSGQTTGMLSSHSSQENTILCVLSGKSECNCGKSPVDVCRLAEESIRSVSAEYKKIVTAFDIWTNPVVYGIFWLMIRRILRYGDSFPNSGGVRTAALIGRSRIDR
jgi:hypothetical protein